MITKDQQKDLRPIKPNEFKIDSYFYFKNCDQFEQFRIHKQEFDKANWFEKEQWKKWITDKCKAGLLFVRLNKPYHSFV